MAGSLVWLRRDLRLNDNPALMAAASRGPVIPVYILDDAVPGWQPGAAARWWLHQSLASLDDALQRKGSRVVLRRGPAGEEIARLIEETGADAVFWNRCYDPASRDRDSQLKAALKRQDIHAESFNGSLLFEPWDIRTGSGQPFQVFTPFWKACRSSPAPGAPLAAPKRLAAPKAWPGSDALASWSLEPRSPDWAGGLRTTWKCGEAVAQGALASFLDDRLSSYPTERDRPGSVGTSRLSPHLAWGEIGPRQVWHSTLAAAHAAGGALDAAAEKFLSELGWREFCWHLAYHNADLSAVNFRRTFDRFPWQPDAKALRAWQRGITGYPIVDAGMRELWTTGWMHNRVRMIVASFLVKHLLIDWREGERWFRDTLVDADYANNSANWQWVAGSGADASPYFRIFNPVLQGERFDADGAYVRRWLPELADLPDSAIHRPWTVASEPARKRSSRSSKGYPAPIVDHGEARRRALEALATLKQPTRGC